MATCYYCGDEIEFRYVDGILRPIHINGGFCSGGLDRDRHPAKSSFDSVQSYLDPNARCPVCGKSVFFYRSPHNGRVFFDDVGWPWPKHGCTDNYKGSDSGISRSNNSRFRFHFRGRDGNARDVYIVSKIMRTSEELLIELQNTARKETVWILIDQREMLEKGVREEDLAEAPSLVLRREDDSGAGPETSFLCARLQSVVVLTARFKSLKDDRPTINHRAIPLRRSGV